MLSILVLEFLAFLAVYLSRTGADLERRYGSGVIRLDHRPIIPEHLARSAALPDPSQAGQ